MSAQVHPKKKTVSKEIYVSGRVQGVGYRAWTVRQANRFGLSGYAENLPDKRVHILVRGDISQVNDFIDLCEQGPLNARVEHIETLEHKGRVKSGFGIRYGGSSRQNNHMVKRIFKKIQVVFNRFFKL